MIYPPIEELTCDKDILLAAQNRLWRLNNLYTIIDQRGNPVRFRMRPAQLQFFMAMHWRNIVLKARQLGFTTEIDLFGLDLVLWNPNMRGGVIAHNQEDARIIFRDKMKYPYSNLPDCIRALVPADKNDAGELLLRNNSGIRVGTSVRSSTLQFLHVSEHGRICAKYPEKAREVKTGSLPAVHENGFVFIESTAQGREGDFYDMCQTAMQNKGRKLSPFHFKMHFFPWFVHPDYRVDPDSVVVPERVVDYMNDVEAKTGVTLDSSQRAWYSVTEGNLGEDMLREHPSTAEEAFRVSLDGTYYAAQIMKAYHDSRVSDVPILKEYPVNTAWDIGEDTTAIWFYQDTQNWRRYVDYVEASGEDLAYYADILQKRGYRYGEHWGPHDLRVTEWGTGASRLESAMALGVAFNLCPNISVDDGINACRGYFSRCCFDESKCDVGLRRLETYRKDWDDERGVWKSRPRHDAASHGADAFRYSVVSSGVRARGLSGGGSGELWAE